eukprot:7102967-Pyramimonas_sp.AAC.1
MTIVLSDRELCLTRSFGAMCVWRGDGDFMTDRWTSERSLTCESVAVLSKHRVLEVCRGQNCAVFGGGDGWLSLIVELEGPANLVTYDNDPETVFRCMNNITSE